MRRREKEAGGRAGEGYTGRMDSIAAQPGEGPKGRAAQDPPPADLASAGGGAPLAIAAWSAADPEVAARLLEAWLATADAEGTLSPACPVACILAAQVAAALPDAEAFLSRILPALSRCVAREFDRYDAKGTGLPIWPSAEEALFPGEYRPGRVTVDLAVLLSNEAAAFCDLAEGRPGFERALDQAEGEQRELDEWLKRSFWNEEESMFHRYDEGGASVPDPSPCGFFPLVWGGRAAEMVEGLRPRAADWDPSAWPARAWVLFFALLLRTPHRSVVAQMRRTGLPAGASPAESAAWAALSACAERAQPPLPRRIQAPARWLDAHGKVLARAARAGVAALVAGCLGWGFFHREDPGTTDIAEMERQARLACAEGRHDRAAALYGRAARRGNETYFRYRQAGEWMHLERFADAEAAYRALLERDPGAPNARVNLALAVWRQGRREEARSLYRAFGAAADAESHPELAARARLAADLIGRQLALDRPESDAAAAVP